MRKTDIKLGTEYCETAPMAYGREPSTPAKRVRFTSIESAQWVLVTEMVATQWDQYVRWETDWDTVRIMKLGDVPDGVLQRPGSAIDAGIGTRVTTHSMPEKGVLPAERYDPNTGTWRPCLALPAAIHRTWAEHATKQGEKAQRDENWRQEAKVDDITALLKQVGLDGLFYVDNSQSALRVTNTWRDGSLFLSELQTWAAEKGLADG